MAKKCSKKSSMAGKALQSPKTSKTNRSKAGKVLNEHKKNCKK